MQQLKDVLSLKFKNMRIYIENKILEIENTFNEKIEEISRKNKYSI